ncbi:MAG TPA: hypothetical protein VK517_17520 [Cyclobacteriaceae bacterium]|jgi:hypothetical protein|nr:hypothetical protein [Cyclobacteriaceae bacterium]
MEESIANSVKQSYFNILALFLEAEKMETRFVRCLLKWGLQLKLTQNDINTPAKKLEQLQFSQPSDKVAQLEAIYHLVEMINIDKVVDDVELEVASIYAEKLGFKRQIVGDLLKSIATKDSDGASSQNIHKEVIDFLKINES